MTGTCWALGSHSGADKDLSLVECDAVSVRTVTNVSEQHTASILRVFQKVRAYLLHEAGSFLRS